MCGCICELEGESAGCPRFWGLGDETAGSVVGVIRRCLSGRGHRETGDACTAGLHLGSDDVSFSATLPLANKVSGT